MSKKHLFLLIFFMAFKGLDAQINIEVYFEKLSDGYNIYVDNYEYCPISLKINFTTRNLDTRGGNNRIYVVRALQKRALVTKLRIVNRYLSYQFNYTYTVNYGDHFDKKYDENYIYNLPFPKHQPYEVSQGYNGDISHQNENYLDFKMPIQTKIYAIRSGVVVKVVDYNFKNCIEKECQKYNNYILVYHSDGTFADYAHIMTKGSVVARGDKVKKGDLIGYSGNVGWSSGPHLHLGIFLQKLFKRKTLKTKFYTNNGELSEYLVEKNKYVKEY